MKQVTFYSIETGDITRIATLEDDMVDANTQEGEGYLEGIFDAATQKVVDGAITDIDVSVIENNKQQDALNDFRELRDSLLADTDWTQLPDSPLSESKKTEWKIYRQALRDMPSQEDFDPLKPTFPTEPS